MHAVPRGVRDESILRDDVSGSGVNYRRTQSRHRLTFPYLTHFLFLFCRFRRRSHHSRRSRLRARFRARLARTLRRHLAADRTCRAPALHLRTDALPLLERTSKSMLDLL